MLNTENKNLFTAVYEELELAVLGGLNDTNVESLRITIKVNKIDSYASIRHNINLYNATQVEKFIRKVSEELESGFVSVRKAILMLINDLETYRLDSLESVDDEAVSDYQLPSEEYEEALELLESKQLLDETNNLIGSTGIIGEENNRLLMYLIFTSRLLSNPLHCISFGSSGAGKTHLQSKVSELIPKEHKVEITMLSAKALFYYNRYELKNKLILIEDMDGASEGLLPLRELQTKKRITHSAVHKGVGGKGSTNSNVVEGPVCVSGCTTQESIYEDNSNRSFLLYIDESNEQDERIMKYQRMHYAGKVDVDHQLKCAKKLRNVQRLLKPIRVVNPYAEYLELPKSVFKPRRTNIHYLQLIEVITFYHQYQREEKFDEVSGEAYIETELQDIQLANTLIKDVLLRKSDNLNGVTRNYLESLTAYLKVHKSNVFSNQDVRRAFRISEPTLRRYHKLLLQEGYIRERDDIKGVSKSYELLHADEFKSLEQSIEKALELCIEQFVTSSQPRHSHNDELNPL